MVGASRRGTGGEGWTGLVMDVDSDEYVRAGVQGVLVDHGQVAALVACAGWGLSGPGETTTIEEARAQVETIFWGCVRVTSELLPAMRSHGSGWIVLMSSIGGLIAIPRFYGQALHHAIGVLERDERNGADPLAVARGWPGYSPPATRADGCRWARPANGWDWSPNGHYRTGGSGRLRSDRSALSSSPRAGVPSVGRWAHR